MRWLVQIVRQDRSADRPTAPRAAARRCLAGACRVALVALLLPAWAAAQQGRGSISGTVTDSSGGAVPDATVTITNVGTQAAFSARTNDAGFYTAPSLPVGEYPGVGGEDRLQDRGRQRHHAAGRRRRQVDPKLELGEVTEVIEVRATAPLVNTSTATLGKVIENRRVTELPLNGRNALSLMALAPSVKSSAGPTAERLLRSRHRALADQHQRQPARHQQLPPRRRHQQPELSCRHQHQSDCRRRGGVQGPDQQHVVRVRLHRRRRGQPRHEIGHEPVPRQPLRLRAQRPLRRQERARRPTSRRSSYNQSAARSAARSGCRGSTTARIASFFFYNFEGWQFKREQPTTQSCRPRRCGAATSRTCATPAGNPITIYDPATTRANPDGNGFIRDPFPAT